jgi:predicted DNA-binding protein with PD1-like motif
MHFSSDGKFYAFRLRPHQDLKNGILAFARQSGIRSGAVISCVGSLEQLSLRFANQRDACDRSAHFEILTLTGTFSTHSAHLHMSVADHQGHILGGHVLENNFVFTTAEIVVITFPGVEFAREKDDAYGYHELVVKQALS